MRRVLLAGVALATLLRGAASAADLPAYKALPPVGPYNWSGCYFGGQLGQMWAGEDWTNRTPGSASFGSSYGSHDARVSGRAGRLQLSDRRSGVRRSGRLRLGQRPWRQRQPADPRLVRPHPGQVAVLGDRTGRVCLGSASRLRERRRRLATHRIRILRSPEQRDLLGRARDPRRLDRGNRRANTPSCRT